MKKKIIKAVSLLAAMACILCVPIQASAASQGTEGTELEVVQPQQLVVQLGEAWSGVEFQLRTDAGMYPDAIPVGEDGILRLEIGGSENYTLTCLDSSVEAPTPEDMASTEESTASEGSDETEGATEATVDTTAPAASEEETSAPEETAADTQVTEPEADAEIAKVGEVPVTHIVIFVGGLVIAIALLLFMQHSQKNRETAEADDDEDI